MAATALSPLAVLSAKKAAQAANSASQSDSASPAASGFSQALQARTNRSNSSDTKTATSKLASNVKAQTPSQSSKTQAAASSASSTDAAAAAAAATLATPLPSDADAALLAAISGLANAQTAATPQNATPTEDEALAAQTAGLTDTSAKLAALPGETPLPEQGKKDLELSDEKSAPLREESSTATPKLGLQSETTKNSLSTVSTGQNDFASELKQVTANTQTATAPLGSTAHNAGVTTQATQTTDTLPAHEVRTPVAARGWTEEVGQKISWIASRDAGRAELILTPPQLGRIEVSIHISGDQASANFVAASAAARDALNDSMPRLREVLADAGINLGQADVSANGSNQSQGGDSQDSARSGRLRGMLGASDSTSSPVQSSGSSMLRAFNGRVDTFA